MTFPTIIVQARYNSTRLPGKMLMEIAGKPLLSYVVERAKRARKASGVIVATSCETSDDPIIEICERLGYPYVRGSLDNVAERFRKVIEAKSIQAFVRISGDSPLIDPSIIDQGISIFEEGEYDVVSNVIERSFPKGQSVEVLRSKAFLTTITELESSHDLEHVTPFFYRHSDRFRIRGYTMTPNHGAVQLSVDTRDDFDAVSAIINLMDKPHWSYRIEALLHLHKQVMG